MINRILLAFGLAAATFVASADVTISWDPNSAIGITELRHDVLRWEFGQDESNAQVIGSPTWPGNQLVITNHEDGVWEYCVVTVGIITGGDGTELTSECQDARAGAIVEGGVVKKNVVPNAPANIKIN